MPPPHATSSQWRARYLAPTLALTAAGLMIAISLVLPYWELRLTTPAHPGNLQLLSYLDHMEGPLDSVLSAAGRSGNGRLTELSELERSLTVATAMVICLLVVAATFVHNRWAALLSLPALAFPAIVVADTARWLEPILGGLAAAAGAPASQPLALFGRMALAEIVVETRPRAGLYLAVAASLAVVCGLWLHRRAYKPDAILEGGPRQEPAERGDAGAL